MWCVVAVLPLAELQLRRRRRAKYFLAQNFGMLTRYYYHYSACCGSRATGKRKHCEHLINYSTLMAM